MTARDTPKALVSSVQAWENGRAGKRANAPRPLATPTSRQEVPGMTRAQDMTEKARWTLARAVDRLPGTCWVDLVDFAQGNRPSPVSSNRKCGPASEDYRRCGSCYCGKLRTEATS